MNFLIKKIEWTSPLCCLCPMGWGNYNRLFTDKLSYIRIPLILLVSHLFLCPTYCRLFLMLSGNYSSDEINFFLRILVERIFCFHMGISRGGVVGDFPFVSVSLRDFPFILLSLVISLLLLVTRQ